MTDLFTFVSVLVIFISIVCYIIYMLEKACADSFKALQTEILLKTESIPDERERDLIRLVISWGLMSYSNFRCMQSLSMSMLLIIKTKEARYILTKIIEYKI